ncbi:MAG: hypothetical protein BroJett015_21970 [Chloroflexota bacterium]|nr:MAG: hypothetical protein BroJett015_21970 [Chloroflexota bacterium]
MSLEAQLKKLKAYFYRQKSAERLILPSHIRLAETYQYELSISLQLSITHISPQGDE